MFFPGTSIQPCYTECEVFVGVCSPSPWFQSIGSRISDLSQHEVEVYKYPYPQLNLRKTQLTTQVEDIFDGGMTAENSSGIGESCFGQSPVFRSRVRGPLLKHRTKPKQGKPRRPVPTSLSALLTVSDSTNQK